VEPEPALIERAIGGDHQAFAALVEPLRMPVWRFLCRYLSDQALAEDVTQDTFLRVYTRMGSFRGGSRFSTWVFQIARNAAIDADRSRRRRAKLAQAVTVGALNVSAAPDLEVEIDHALSSLSPKLRQVFVLVEVVGLSYRETSEVLGVAEGTVKSRMFLARERLTEWIRRDEM
jgi:RNA polymerase sigma-70 factor (ECF subfamily)